MISEGRFGFTAPIPPWNDQVLADLRNSQGRVLETSFDMLAPGEYDLCVSVGTRQGTPKIALPIAGGNARRYSIGKVTVSKEARIEIVSPAENVEFSLLTPEQKKFIAMSSEERRKKMTDAAWRKELKARTGWNPAKLRIEWKDVKSDAEYQVVVRRMPDGKVAYREQTSKNHVELDNLEVARTYELEVSSDTVSVKRTFRTSAELPRFTRIDGVPNMRDLGGHVGLGGRRVKQGMIYRSGGLNGNANKYYSKEEILDLYKSGKLVETVPELSREAAKEIKRHLDAGDDDKADFKHLVKKWHPGPARMTDASCAYARKQFGIKTDLDLRTVRECYGMTGSPLGPDVNWVSIPSPSYGPMHEDFGHESFKKCFRIFLDEANYPIDFHCIQGADRTGCLAYILEALLGVSDAELEQDWEVTAFTNPNPRFAHAERYDRFVAGFGKYPGSSSCEKVEAYVKARGFTDADIAKFRSLMLEK